MERPRKSPAGSLSANQLQAVLEGAASASDTECTKEERERVEEDRLSFSTRRFSLHGQVVQLCGGDDDGSITDHDLASTSTGSDDAPVFRDNGGSDGGGSIAAVEGAIDSTCKGLNQEVPTACPELRKLPNLEDMFEKFEEGYDSDGYRPEPHNSEEDDFEEETIDEMVEGEEATVMTDCALGEKTSASSIKSFAPGAHWMPLKLKEPDNAEGDCHSATFERPQFTGKKHVPFYHANGSPTETKDGKQECPRELRKLLHVRHDFLKKNRLTRNSDPIEFVDAFIPWGKNISCKSLFSLTQATAYTNLKASLSNAGGCGKCCQDYTRQYTVKELRQHLGLYILNGLNPSPKLELKFRSQADDPVQGNDFIVENMGANLTRRHEHFKTFFALCDPSINPPDRKKNPLWKVAKVIEWVNKSGVISVDLGMSATISEQTMGFQGGHGEGDVFKCDAICQDEFTYSVHFRNEPPPLKWTSEGFKPFAARVLWLLDQLKDKHHRLYMDNLRLSATLCKACFQHDKKVLVAGVTRRIGRGIPSRALQQEVTTNDKRMHPRGRVKAAILKGDPGCPNLVAVSVCDTEPLHVLSMVAKSVQGALEQRPLAHSGNNCRLDLWPKDWKWWWSIWMWAFEALMTNAYVCYKKAMSEEFGMQERRILSHYEFRKRVALAWIRKDEPTMRQRKKTNNANDLHQSGAKRCAPTSNDSRASKRSGKSNAPSSTASAKRKRAPRMSDNAIKSSFQSRLNRFVSEGHNPVTKSGQRIKCQLHAWTAGLEVKSKVFACSHCKVSLCIPCFTIFHTDDRLVENKEFYRKRHLREKEEKDERGKKD